MKTIAFILLSVVTIPLFAQKTTREIVAKVRDIDITKSVTESSDGSQQVQFYMMGQNVQYSRITDIITVKYGTANEIGELLVECLKFLPEKSGTTLEFNGTTIGATGKNQVIVWDVDNRGAVLLRRDQISTLLEGLRKHL